MDPMDQTTDLAESNGEEDIDMLCHEDSSFIEDLPIPRPSLDLEDAKKPAATAVKLNLEPLPYLDLSKGAPRTVLGFMKERSCLISPRESKGNISSPRNISAPPSFVDAGLQNQPPFVLKLHRLSGRYAFVLRRVHVDFGDHMAYLVAWIYTLGEIESSAKGVPAGGGDNVRQQLFSTFHLDLVPDASVSQATVCSLAGGGGGPIDKFYAPLLNKASALTVEDINKAALGLGLHYVQHWDLMLGGNWDTPVARTFYYEKMVPTARQMLYANGKEVEPADLVRLFVSGRYGITRGAHGSPAVILPDNSILRLRHGGNAQAVENLHNLCLEIRAVQGFLALPQGVRMDAVDAWVKALTTPPSPPRLPGILRAPKSMHVINVSALSLHL